MINTNTRKKLNKEEILEYFKKGCKNDQKTGIEFEKIGILNSNNFATPYSEIKNLLEKLSEFENYKRIFNDNKDLIGLKNENSTITLEPGSQFELSLQPQKELKTLDLQIKTHNDLSKIIAKDLGINFLGTGIQPVSTHKNIKIIPKKRYEIMGEYLPKVNSLGLVMMRETAGIQVGIDYKSEEDAIKKLKLSLKLSPIISAIFSNSPIREGKLTGYKSYRANAWLKTDDERCGLINPKLFDKNYNYTFEDYINDVLNTQMIMLGTKNPQAVENLTFKQFLKDGYKGLMPQFDDFIQHLSLYFTDTRLKTYLEIRNHDSQKGEFIMCIPALWKSIIYDEDTQSEIEKILSKFAYEDFENLRQLTPKYGLNCKIKNYNLTELAKEILNISHQTLKKYNEEHYIEPILELVTDKMTPADVIIQNFEGIWNKDINKFIKFSQI